MKLVNYLKQFKNIAWYPSANKDTLSLVCLSYKSLYECGVDKASVPDCFIFTDYETYADQASNRKFFLDLDEDIDEANFAYQDQEYKATAFNIRELDKLNVSFDPHLVAFDHDYYYGRVFIMDVLVEHPIIGKSIAKVIYVISENTAFAFDFLIKNHIEVKYVIHSRYGQGFGGGISNGGFLANILKDLNTKYFVSDMDYGYDYDVADEYLTGFQRHTLPILRKIVNFNYRYKWCGHSDTVLYEIITYQKIEGDNNDLRRYIIYQENEHY